MAKKKRKKQHRFFWFVIKLQIVLMLLVLGAAGVYFFGGYASLSCVEIDNIVVGAYVNLNFGVRIKRLNMSIGYEAMPGYASLEIYDNGQYDFYDYNLRINSFVFRMGVDIGRRVD